MAPGLEVVPGLTDAAARRGIITVAAATIFLYLSLYLYVPFLPLRAAELGASNTMIGLVIAGFAVGQVVLRLPIGIGADLIGRRKPFAVGSLALATVGGLGLALAPNTGMLFAARLLTGASVAGWVAITVLFSSYYRPNDTAKAMSRIMTVWAAGLVLGTFAGGVVAEVFGTEATFWGSVGAGAIGTALIVSAPEPRKESAERYGFATVRQVASSGLLLRLAVIGIGVQFIAFATYFAFIPVYAESFGASLSTIGYITTFTLAAAMAGTLITPMVIGRVGYRVTVTGALVVVGTATAAVTLADTSAPLFLIQGVAGLGHGVLSAALMALVAMTAIPRLRATAMGLYQSMYGVGVLAGPLVAGVVADGPGLDGVFLVTAIVAAGAAVMALVTRMPRTTGN
ncbi:MAG TPA: MFS transporter [Dehalococcoidia bacterium]|jgi:MFS family permease|nr:MFS transporter [Dehalococcoidia bacterium]MDP7514398.1 MFS transporter [Dehalococcoidia bacterium]HJM54546.1 MFS transporter [Dehalococcoidia bacterium]